LQRYGWPLATTFDFTAEIIEFLAYRSRNYRAPSTTGPSGKLLANVTKNGKFEKANVKQQVPKQKSFAVSSAITFKLVLTALKLQQPPTPSYVNPNPWIGPDQDATRRRPAEVTCSQTCRDQKRPFSFSARRCSTPKPRSRGLNTHTPLRTGRAPQNVPTGPAGLVRIHTPLRFSGYRPKSDIHRKTESTRPKSAPSKCVPAPRPLTGISSSLKQKR